MVGLVSTGFALRIEDLRPLILRLPVTQSLTHSLTHTRLFTILILNNIIE
jgi:hypothetical protein